MKEGSAREGDDDSTSLLLTRADAAKLLGHSLSHFCRHVAPHLPKIRSGSMVQFTRADLEAWIEAQRQQTTVAEQLSRARKQKAGKQRELVIDPRFRLRPRPSTRER